MLWIAVLIKQLSRLVPMVCAAMLLPTTFSLPTAFSLPTTALPSSLLPS